MNRRRLLSTLALGVAASSTLRCSREPEVVEVEKPVEFLYGVEMIPRADWATAELGNPDRSTEMATIERLTIHHDGMPTAPMATDEEIRKRVVAIRESHLGRQYADIGYHFVVDPLGRVWEGRPLTCRGAHVRKHNEGNVGVMVLGNFQVEQPAAPALVTLEKLTLGLMQEREVAPKMVFTHRELASSGCPGKHLQAEIDKARLEGGYLLG